MIIISSPIPIKIREPIVIGNFEAKVSESKASGRAVKIKEMIIKIIGKITSNLKKLSLPLTLKGRGVSGSIFLNLKNAGNTGT